MNRSLVEMPTKLNDLVSESETLDKLHSALSKHVDNLGYPWGSSHHRTLGLILGICAASIICLVLLFMYCYCKCYKQGSCRIVEVNRDHKRTTDHVHATEFTVMDDGNEHGGEPVMYNEPVTSTVPNVGSMAADSNVPEAEPTARPKRSTSAPSAPRLPRKLPRMQVGFWPVA